MIDVFQEPFRTGHSASWEVVRSSEVNGFPASRLVNTSRLVAMFFRRRCAVPVGSRAKRKLTKPSCSPNHCLASLKNRVVAVTHDPFVSRPSELCVVSLYLLGSVHNSVHRK